MRPINGGKKFIKAFMSAQLRANKLGMTLYLDYRPKTGYWAISDKKSEDSMTVKPIPPEIMATMRMK